jgi:hypothetical protein
MPHASQAARKVAETRSAYAFGVTPAAAAASAILSPCSSVPVRKNVSAPGLRAQRAVTSARTVVYVWPRCGSAFT